MTIPPTGLDLAAAHAIERHVTPPEEAVTRILTLLADEKVILAVSSALWVYLRLVRRSPRAAWCADKLMLCSLASAAFPHVLKRVFDRKRPDRTVVHGHRRGIPRSGNPYDSFPSGHAVHIGALANAISGMVSPQLRPAVWTPAMALAATRLVLLAHYPSDVAIGLAIGIGLERVVAAVLPRDPGEPVGDPKLPPFSAQR